MNTPQFYEYGSTSIAFGGFFAEPKSDYMEVVRTRASQGWRLHQMVIFPDAQGGPKTLELVFERPARGPQDVLRADDGDDRVEQTTSAETRAQFKQPGQERPPWTPWSGPIP